MITIVGLGIAAGDLTLDAAQALTSGARVLLRTARVPAADWLRLAPAHLRYQRAGAAGAAALAAWERGEAVDCAALAPVYLRLPQAERELLKKQSGAAPGKGTTP